MEKETRKEFKGLESAMTPLQIKYACDDAIGTWLVDKEQQKIISETNKVIWNNLYNPHVWTTLELGGFKLDVDAWTELAEKNQAIVDEISEKLGKEYGVTKTKTVGRGKAKHEEEYFEPFNPSSNAQVKSVLLTQYHLDLESTDDDHIRPYYESNEFVKSILDYRKAEKQVTTYGLSFLKNMEEDGRIYTSLNIGLAESGRDSSSSPNLQNIPSTKERRKCFVAGEGKKLVLYDYSGQEAGTWAYITGDEKFKEIINTGKKLYIEVARIAFNEEIKKGTPRYAIIKALVLGLMYGLSPYGFARDNREELEKEIDPSLTGKEKEKAVYEIAEKMFQQFMDGFPTSAKWMKEQQARNKGIANTIIGRHAHLHPYDRQWKNNALNTPNQGSGGDMIKLAMKKLRQTDFYKKYYPEGKVCLLLQIHDEIVAEVVEELAEEWDKIMKKVMIDVAESLTPGIRGGVSGGADGTGIINNWSEKS
jgi:DNA polymerase-1